MGLIMGLSVGLGSKFADAGATVLFDADFRTPSTSWSAGRAGFSSAFAEAEWLLQETSGSYADNIGSADIDTFNGGLQGQTAVGVYDGSSYTARKAWETDSDAAYARTTSTTVLDSNNEDIATRIVFRCAEDGGATRTLWSKRDGLNSGWTVLITSAGVPQITLEDTGGTTVTLTLTGQDVCDGALHYLSFWYDYSADTLYAKTDLGSSSVSTASITNSLTNSIAVSLGDPQVGSTAAKWQYCYVGGASGANAESLYSETFWNHAVDPTGLLTTQTRASLVSVPVASGGYVAHFADDTLPIGYHSAFTHASELGLYVNSATKNELAYSENINGQWTATNASKAADTGDAPDGFRSAHSFTATAANGNVYRNMAATTASTEYNGSIWVKRNGAFDVTGKIRLEDTNAATNTDQTFTATSTWQLIDVTHTMGGAGAAGRFSVFIDDSSKSLLIWGGQVELGDARNAYIRTDGASASLATTDYRALGTAGQYCKAATGEIEATCVFTHDNTGNDRTVYVNNGSANNVNSRDLYRSSVTLLRAVGYDSSAVSLGTLSHTSIASDTLYVQRFSWDESGGLSPGGGEDMVSLLNGGDQKTDVGTFTSTEDLTTVHVGNYRSPNTLYATDAFIARIQIFDAENV